MASFPTQHGAELRAWMSGNLGRFAAVVVDDPADHRAAVALTVVPDSLGRACFILTRRAATLRNHSGQFAIPGGRVDRGETVEETALRELHEEVGLSLEPNSLIGRLDDFRTRSGFVISPIVAWADGGEDLVANPSEVAKIFRVPLGDLDRDDVPFLTDIPESDQQVLSMPILEHRVHAPTAALIYQLLEVALRGRQTRVAHYEQPVFAWR